jgi:hypothetical protein
MTMSNQMALSAASVAVMANNNTLVNMGSMQESFFELDGSTINAGLKATSLQAAAEEKSIIDGAQAQRINAGCQLGGALAGMAVTVAGIGMGSSSYSKASDLEAPSTNLQAGFKEIPANEEGIELQPMKSSIPAAPLAEDAAVAKITGTNSSDPAPVARIQGSVANDDSNADAQEETAKAEIKKAEAATNPNAETAKGLRSMGDFYMQNGNTFGGLINSAVSSSGGFGAYDTTVDQANQSKIKDLEAGLAQALSSQTSLIGSQLGNLDQSRSNTYQLMSSLQQVRG